MRDDAGFPLQTGIFLIAWRPVICIILFALNEHPDYPVIIAANRDEFAVRPTEAFHRWQDEPTIFAGRDNRQGGTWLGVSTSGRIAMVTNYRESSTRAKNVLSRGELPLLYLRESVDDFPTHLKTNGQQYGPVNLLWGNRQGLYHWSNRGETKIQHLNSGIHGLSNAFLNTPWPKVERGKQALAALLSEGNVGPEHLFGILSDSTQASDLDLPNTGISKEAERALSSIRIPLFNGYGSLTATVLRVATSGRIEVWEKNYASGDVYETKVE